MRRALVAAVALLAFAACGDDEDPIPTTIRSTAVEDVLPFASTTTEAATITTAAPTTVATTAAPTTRATAAPTSKVTAAPTTVAASVYYADCSEARAAGAAPVRRGDPGYGSHLDRDGDGVGCES